MKPWAVALAVLAAAFFGHHAYRLAPVELEGHAWNVGGSIARLLLLGLVAYAYRSPLVDVPASWLMAEEVQAVGCTVAYIIKPWPMPPGADKCSEALGLPLNVACMVALLWIAVWLADKLGRAQK
jgi:hypothetical protein